jgi:hypothetical protein
MTLFNYWHFIVLFVILLFGALGVYSAFQQEKKKLILPMVFSVSLVTILLASFSVVVVDKYTKKAKLYKLKNRRILQQEKIMYTGIVKNEGKFKIGKVSVEIKLVNRGMATGNVKGGSFYKPSGFLDFFKGGENKLFKPQQIVKEFVVAKNLKPGAAKSFRVYFDYPPYFSSVSQFTKVYAH